jgi:K+-transporting ATPase KdpF subunit
MGVGELGAAVVGLAILVYLTYALLFPEQF